MKPQGPINYILNRSAAFPEQAPGKVNTRRLRPAGKADYCHERTSCPIISCLGWLTRWLQWTWEKTARASSIQLKFRLQSAIVCQHEIAK